MSRRYRRGPSPQRRYPRDPICRDLWRRCRDGLDAHQGRRTTSQRSPARRWLGAPHSTGLERRGPGADWEKEKQPVVMRTLAARYRQTGQFEDAERCLRVYIEVAPTYEGYTDLAEVYKQQKKMDMWQETLEASLKIADVGLNHAGARVQLAQEFMRQKDYKKALPYAEAAAESFAA